MKQGANHCWIGQVREKKRKERERRVGSCIISLTVYTHARRRNPKGMARLYLFLRVTRSVRKLEMVPSTREDC